MLPSRGVFAVRGPFGNTPRQFTAIAERSRMHQDDILPWLNAREHTSATSCQESGPLHKPARKDEEHGGQPAPFALVDQYEPSRKLPGMRLSGRATAAWAQDAKRVRTPGSARRGQHARVRAPGAVCQGSHAGGVVCQGQHARVRVPRAARRGPNAGVRPLRLACQSTRRAESLGTKKRRSEERRLPRKTTGANQIRPES